MAEESKDGVGGQQDCWEDVDEDEGEEEVPNEINELSDKKKTEYDEKDQQQQQQQHAAAK